MYSDDEKYMKLALSEAEKAAMEGEVPVGAVVVKNSEVIASAHNRRENDKSAVAHAEVIVIEEACKKVGSWRLNDCILYVTLEPCPMCTGALINSRIQRVVFGVKDPKAGALGSVLNMNFYPLNHKLNIRNGILENECREVLKSFFLKRRLPTD